MATGFTSRCGNGKYRLQFHTDSKADYLFVRGDVRHCVAGKAITEADLFRAMNDEELADFLAERDTVHWYARVSEGGYEPTQNQRRVAKQGFYEKWLRYLKKEVEGNRWKI